MQQKLICQGTGLGLTLPSHVVVSFVEKNVAEHYVDLYFVYIFEGSEWPHQTNY